MDIERLNNYGNIAIVGAVAAVVGALWPSDWVFLFAAGATTGLAWVCWGLGRRIHRERDPWQQAGGTVSAVGLMLATVGFLVALWAALSDRPDIVFASLSSAVSAGMYVVLPMGLVLLGLRFVRWPELSTIGRALPLAMGVLGVVAIPATVLISLPDFPPGRFATLLGLLREVVILGWLPLGIALRRARSPAD
jgi:hypothetical protein